MKTKSIFSALLISVLSITQIQAQTKYKVYSGFVNHFTKYVQWPADSKSGDFVIAVVGSSPISAELMALNGKMVGAQKIVVKTFPNAGAVNAGHIIFVAEGQSADISAVSKKAKEYNALVVSEIPGGTTKGSDVNFVEEAGKIRFEISSANPDLHGVKVSNDLKKLAIAVN